MIRLPILVTLAAAISAVSIPSGGGYPHNLGWLFGLNEKASTEPTPKPEVCNTDECKLIAKVIKESMDENVDPCDDFYQYSCGNWEINNPVPENDSSWSLWEMVQKNMEDKVEEILEMKPNKDDILAVRLAKKWYNSCMNTDYLERVGVDPILSTLSRHGGWPLIMEPEEWDSNLYTWQKVDNYYQRLAGLSAFHGLYISGGFWEEEDRRLVIETPKLPTGWYMFISRGDIEDDEDENGSQERGSEQEDEDNDEDEGEDKDEDEDEDEDENEGTDEDVETDEEKKEDKDETKEDSKDNEEDEEKKMKRRKISKKKMLPKKRKASNPKHLSHSKKSRNKVHKVLKKQHAEKKTKERVKRAAKSKLHSKKQRKQQKETKRQRVAKHQRAMKHQKGMKHHTGHKGSKIIVKTSKLHKKMIAASGPEESTTRINSEENEVDTGSEDKNENTNENSNDNDGDNKKDENGTDDDNGDETDDDDSDNDNYEDDSDDNDDDDDDEDDNDDDDEDSDYDYNNSMEIDKEELKEKYKQYILEVAQTLAEARGIEMPKEKIVKSVEDMFEFYFQLIKISLVNDEYMNMTINEFQEMYDSFEPQTSKSKVNWMKKIKVSYDEASVQFDGNLEVIVNSARYMKRLRALLDETPDETIVNYVHWNYIATMAKTSTEKIRKFYYNWYDDEDDDDIERAGICTREVRITEMAGYEYVRKYFSDDIARTAMDMIDDIQKEVEYQIKESKWMDEKTKDFILDKLVNMEKLVGYPSWYRNSTAVKRYFQGLAIGPSFYENTLSYMRAMGRKMLQFLQETDIEFESWLIDPLTVNAFFIPTENSITITAADFESPFFAFHRPQGINYGIIGFIMAHEVNHGFDDEGHLYDKNGNVMEWLSAMAEAYNKRAECFVNQFNKYSILRSKNVTIKDYGNQTAGENIADTMGLQAVFRAYRRRQRECEKPDTVLPGLENFDSDQLFFLSFGSLWCETENPKMARMQAKYDVHSTARLRVIGSVSNSEDFAKAYNCPVGSPMNPKKKCNIWK